MLVKKGSVLIYSDANWNVYEINTYQASVKYGKDTQWCITGTNAGLSFGKDTFDKYNKGADIYFYLNRKNRYKKICSCIQNREELDTLC